MLQHLLPFITCVTSCVKREKFAGYGCSINIRSEEGDWLLNVKKNQ